LNDFPLKTQSDLDTVEIKLKNDYVYRDQMVSRMFVFYYKMLLYLSVQQSNFSWVLSALGVGTPRGRPGISKSRTSHFNTLNKHGFILYFIQLF